MTKDRYTATLLADGRVLIAGGEDQNGNPVAAAELYDPQTGKFTQTGSMATAREYATATRLSDGRVLVAGGTTGSGTVEQAYSSAELFDPTLGSFAPAGTMTVARYSAAAVLMTDGEVLITGGDGGGTELSSAEIYAP